MYHRLKALFKGPSVRQRSKVAAKLSALLLRSREVLARTQTSSTAGRQTVLAHARIYLHTKSSGCPSTSFVMQLIIRRCKKAGT